MFRIPHSLVLNQPSAGSKKIEVRFGKRLDIFYLKPRRQIGTDCTKRNFKKLFFYILTLSNQISILMNDMNQVPLYTMVLSVFKTKYSKLAVFALVKRTSKTGKNTIKLFSLGVKSGRGVPFFERFKTTWTSRSDSTERMKN